MVGHNVKIDLEAVQLSILWDKQQFITVEASAGLWNRTAGLCGTLDQDINNDFRSKLGVIFKAPATFIDSWKTPELDTDKFSCIMEQNNEVILIKLLNNFIQITIKFPNHRKINNVTMTFKNALSKCAQNYLRIQNYPIAYRFVVFILFLSMSQII